VHDEFRPRIEKARTTEEARAVLQGMLDTLHESHFAILPTEAYVTIRGSGGGPGSAGFAVRVVGGKALVTSVDAGSPAARAGVRPGWDLLRSGADEMAPLIARVDKVYHDSTLRELMLGEAIDQRLAGSAGESREFVFDDGNGNTVRWTIVLAKPPGNVTQFGFLPPMYVSFEARRVRPGIGYFRLNVFLDVSTVMDAFGRAVEDCANCRGFIIDVRGNPGGIGAMAMGIASWFVDQPGQQLGTLYLRDSTLKFTIFPRLNPFKGRLAFLVDGASASTSEILAGGLQDLGRARIFGTRTAGAALPSVIEVLPNGDGFQYAVANYISNGGKPLEGRGVTPDAPVELTRKALLAGEDVPLNAAILWIAGP
jgi:carboxyl-terminal processing protease